MMDKALEKTMAEYLACQNYWIPCAERMPDEEDLYIVCYEDGDLGVCIYLQKPEEQEHESHWVNPLNCNWDAYDVEYWMEFPDPPIQKGE